MLIGGGLGLTSGIFLIAKITWRYRACVTTARIFVTLRPTTADASALGPPEAVTPARNNQPADFDYQKMIDQVNITATQCAFVSGNVFFGMFYESMSDNDC